MLLKDFIKQHAITSTAEQIDGKAPEPGESKDDAKWRESASHWTVTLSFGNCEMETSYSMGSAYGPKYGYKPGVPGGPFLLRPQEKPGTIGVLLSVLSDCQSIDCARGFLDWAGDLGYDLDSRNAEKVYRACQDQSQLVRSWLGRELYNVFLECTED